MSESETSEVWPRGMPRVGQTAERSERVEPTDVERSTEISGDRNPLYYDEARDTITRTAKALEVRADKPITKLAIAVTRDDGALVLDGDALCGTTPLPAP